MSPDDETIERQLRAAPPEAWTALWTAVEALEAEGVHLTWGGGQQTGTLMVDGEERPVHQMPYAQYSEAVYRAIGCLGPVGAFVVFAWPSWEGLERLRGPSALETAPVADAARMLTAIVRSERFTDGSIAGAIEEGTFGAAIRRLRRWHDQQTSGDAGS